VKDANRGFGAATRPTRLGDRAINLVFWCRLLGVVHQRLLEQLAADADVIERAVIVGHVAGVDDPRTLPVLLRALHLQDPDFELAIRPNAAHPREWMTP